MRDLMVPGVRFIEIAKASLRRRTIPEAIGRERQWLREWAAQLRLPRSMVHRKLNDRWFQLNMQRLSDGSLVMIGADITEVIPMKLREEEDGNPDAIGKLRFDRSRHRFIDVDAEAKPEAGLWEDEV